RDPALRKNTVLSFTAGIDYLAVNGLGPFKEALPKVQLLGNYNLGAAWLVTLDPQIRTPRDLAGKRIALGRAPQILWSIEPLMVIEHGWKLKGKIDVQHLGPKPAAQALLDGQVDAAIIGGYVDPISGTLQLSPQTTELL